MGYSPWFFNLLKLPKDDYSKKIFNYKDILKKSEMPKKQALAFALR
jgi:hypothetical protein